MILFFSLGTTVHANDDLASAETVAGTVASETVLFNGATPYRDEPVVETQVGDGVSVSILDGEETIDVLPLVADSDPHGTGTVGESTSGVGADRPIFLREEQGETVVVLERQRGWKEKPVAFGDWLGYNSAQSSTTWLAGDQMGMFSLESHPSLELGSDASLVVGTAFHFLNGPKSTDMPPRLFDFVIGYHARRAVSVDDFLDVKFGVGAFSDFEGSARKGVRYPGHFVSYHRWKPDVVSVLGVDVLDRDDVSALPVAGVVFRCLDDLLLELVFPRPRAQLRVSDGKAMYVAGELGGGTWAIERIDRRNDNATYRDLRVTFGVMNFGEESQSVLEFGLAFDRSLEYRSNIGNRDLDSTFLLRCHVLY